MQVQVHMQVPVQCVVYTVQCIGFSVVPATREDLEVLINYFQKPIALVYFLVDLRLFVFENTK